MERMDVNDAVVVLVSFKLPRIIFGISNLRMLIISSPTKETRVSKAGTKTFLEKQFYVIHFKIHFLRAK